ncbi:invasion associated locus B family protein [Psychromarinibacter sp. C21-152]|uniref:Invasion associated locus B family protein n=1 Tax=Psychromarinibacter sediminicola TaxID=3033385 RepID=A0AAE3TAV3_9RHOB|nr:invasion associated locus B family protein [Psychromarinibacter sediminicola]MDF0602379.1 invasion associated locus B family protein [Psychromarinibacter sediminicola]
MKDLIRTLPLALAVALAGPAIAQETPLDEEAPNPMELNMGVDSPEEDGPGSVYTKSTHEDWQLRCIRGPEGNDPCQLYQLLNDANGNPVAEINVFPITDDSTDAAAGATVVTPLETLLTAQLGFKVDDGGVKRYPFAWCSQIGCFARLGFTDEDVNTMKLGAEASILIRPVAAPDQVVTLGVSLTGFTAAYEAAIEANAALQSAPAE